MNNLNEVKDSLGVYLWVAGIGLIGALLNVGARANKSTGRKIIDLIIGSLSSMFLGWIVYEVVFFIYNKEKLALAACGFFAWKGTEWVNVLIDKLIDKYISKRADDIYDIEINKTDEEFKDGRF
ncbi:hypothetical protein KDE12_01155 [Campylobacter sp. faydin G-105]|uniref:hypothetical protein n=1 Tax=Campylobacter anatolicus TaxID=2829105 RepID=UPI001B99A00F|nr:hypothetical protein [Campylobacter anatolicus]MBR8461459.1 hypothetical protein [Campylobacter anatolicus]